MLFPELWLKKKRNFSQREKTICVGKYGYFEQGKLKPFNIIAKMSRIDGLSHQELHPLYRSPHEIVQETYKVRYK